MSEPRRRVPLVRLAWRSAFRNTRRTLLTAVAIVVAVTATIFGQAYINGIMDNMLDTYARIESGHIRIRGEGYTERERFMPTHLFVSDLSDALPVIRTHPGVVEALARIRAMVLVDNAESNQPGLLLGVDIDREEGYLNPAALVAEGRLPRAGYPEVIAGRTFAEEMGFAVGDTLTLLGQTVYRSLGGIRLTVVGLAATGMGYLDAMLLMTPLDQAQSFAYMDDGATEILVFVEDPETCGPIAASLKSELDTFMSGGVEALTWGEQGPIVQAMQTGRAAFGVIFLIMLLMAGLIIINTMLMTVMERTQEFGMLSALGMRGSNILLMVVSEGLAIGLIGATLGGLLGSGISVLVERTGIDLTRAMGRIEFPIEGVLYPDWQLSYTVIGMVLGLVVAGLAALYPAWRAVRMEPAEALRS